MKVKRQHGFSTKGDNAMTHIILSSWVTDFILAWFLAAVVTAVVFACRKQATAR